ncbi:hypothetical protein DAPPUDRAFT_234331 [Daphnia pulex]|uniref:Major facilitator superfamily associated domain-containing protein n=1 Tax=Daphnia pulex TaxID=6669 RepID=E9FWC6_DAPPU|nr:hypothetical protein DAPPUDRAFT_234331 [Daphnia pulex]|eukprot:EFX88453.1 hypothetical protein DAPPUDRAFT_234331 [Daphnia pulex]
MHSDPELPRNRSQKNKFLPSYTQVPQLGAPSRQFHVSLTDGSQQPGIKGALPDMDAENSNDSVRGTEKSVTIAQAENTEKRKGLALLIHDLKQRKLIPMKLLSLIVFSGYGVLLPYVAMHMKSLGISVEETGAIYGLSACVLLSVLFGFNGITALLFLLVPVGRISVVYPTNCFDDNSTLTLTDLDLHPCEVKLNEDSETSVINVSATIGECGSVCYNVETSYGWSGPETSPSLFVNETDKMLPIGKVFSGAVFFPSDYCLDVTCSTTATFGSEVDCTLNRRNSIEQNQAKMLIGLNLASAYSGNITGKYRVNWMTTEGGTKIGQKVRDFQCVSYEEKQKLRYTVNSQDIQAANNRTTSYQMCQPHCIVQISRSDICSNKAREDVVNPQFTFWMYLLLLLIFDVFMSGSGTLFDGASLVLVNEVGGTCLLFVRRFFGIATIGMLTINLNFKPPAQNLIKDVNLISGFDSAAYLLRSHLPEVKSPKRSNHLLRRQRHSTYSQLCSFALSIGYSYLQDPRMCLLLESLEAISWNFARISHVAYANILGTKTTIASIHGLLSGITYGLGCGTGSIGGGLLIGVYGLRVTFRILGAISFITGLLYFLINIFYLRQKKANAKLKNSEKEFLSRLEFFRLILTGTVVGSLRSPLNRFCRLGAQGKPEMFLWWKGLAVIMIRVTPIILLLGRPLSVPSSGALEDQQVVTFPHFCCCGLAQQQQLICICSLSQQESIHAPLGGHLSPLIAQSSLKFGVFSPEQLGAQDQLAEMRNQLRLFSNRISGNHIKPLANSPDENSSRERERVIEKEWRQTNSRRVDDTP